MKSFNVFIDFHLILYIYFQRSDAKRIIDENRDQNKDVVRVERPVLTFNGDVRYLNNVGACGFVCEAIL